MRVSRTQCAAFSVQSSTSMSFFRSPPERAGHFWHCPKVAKRLGAGCDGLGNVVLTRLPCDARRTAAAPNSHIPVLEHRRLLRRSAALLGLAYSAGKLAQHGHPWPALEASKGKL